MDPDAPGNLVPKTVEEDPSLPRIEVNGTTLHAEAFGDPSAPMVMMLHGGPGGDYRSLLPTARSPTTGTTSSSGTSAARGCRSGTTRRATR